MLLPVHFLFVWGNKDETIIWGRRSKLANFGTRPIKMGGVSVAGGAGGWHLSVFPDKLVLPFFHDNYTVSTRTRERCKVRLCSKWRRTRARTAYFPVWRRIDARHTIVHQLVEWPAINARAARIVSTLHHITSLLIHAPSVGLDASSPHLRDQVGCSMRSAILISQHI